MKGLLFLILLFFPLFSFGTLEPYFHKIGKQNGLPTATIYSIEEDAYGRILFGTEKGLFSYNGIQFKSISCYANHSKSIANLRKASPTVFIGQNFNGQLFILNNDELSELVLPQLPPEILNLRVKGDTLLVISLRSVQVYNWRKKKLLQRIDAKEKTTHIFTANFGPNGIALSYTDGYFFDGKKGFHLQQNICYDIERKANQLLLTPIYSTVAAPLLWKNDRVYPWFNLKLKDNPKIHSTNSIGSYTYVCTQSGVIQVAPNGTTNRWFNGYQATKMFRDKRGNYWVSTLNQGVLFIPTIRAVKLTSEPMVSVALDAHKNVYAGNAFGAVYSLSRDGKTQQTYLPKLSLTEASFIEIDGSVLRTPTSVFDLKTGQQLNTAFEYVKHYTKDQNGNFYFAKTYGLLKMAAKHIYERGSEYGNADLKRVEYFTNNRTKDVIVLPDQSIVGACIDGIFVWKNKQKKELLFKKQHIKATHLALLGQKLFVSTHEFGVLVFQNGEFKEQISIKDLNAFGKVIKTIPTKKGVFILTDMDFFVQRQPKQEPTPLRQQFGLNDSEINDFVLDDSLLYFATDNGVIRIPLQEKKREHAHLLIHSLEMNGKSFQPGKHISFDYGENDLTIGIEPILFNKSPSTEIQYRLSEYGSKGKWVSVPISSKTIHFSSLKPGDYTLELRISDDSNSCKQEVHTIQFSLLQPWYLKWYWLVIYAMVLAIVISFLWWLRSIHLHRKFQRQLLQQQLSSELAEAQLTALRAQMNPHFMYNVLNSIQSLVYANKHHEASEYLGKFAQLTRLILELSSKEKTNLKQEFEMLSTYLDLEKMRFGDEFTYSITIDSSIDMSYVQLPTLIVQPFVENALKHGLLHQSGPKNLQISFQQNDDNLEILVVDNGIGREKANAINAKNKEKNSSYATSAVLKKLDLLNQKQTQQLVLTITDLYDEHQNAKGTQVQLIIPQEE